MKKLLIAACGAAMILTAACDTNKASNENAALGDSIATTLGQLAGAQAQSQYEMMMMQMTEAEKANFSKEQFLKGMEMVIKTDTTDISLLYGINFAMRIYGSVYQMGGEAGVPINPDKVVAAIREVYMQDSMTVDMTEVQNAFQSYTMRMQQMAKDKRDNELRNSAEYKANAAAGDSIAAACVAEGYTKAESGLVYKVETEGAEPKATMEDRVKVKYTGKHINGEVFDESGDNAREFRVSGTVPGFAEGLCLLGKGGKATLVIPGELAYGMEGSPNAGIGPNETLIFEVEVVEVVAAK